MVLACRLCVMRWQRRRAAKIKRQRKQEVVAKMQLQAYLNYKELNAYYRARNRAQHRTPDSSDDDVPMKELLSGATPPPPPQVPGPVPDQA